jgi:hypothetical protein
VVTTPQNLIMAMARRLEITRCPVYYTQSTVLWEAPTHQQHCQFLFPISSAPDGPTSVVGSNAVPLPHLDHEKDIKQDTSIYPTRAHHTRRGKHESMNPLQRA